MNIIFDKMLKFLSRYHMQVMYAMKYYVIIYKQNSMLELNTRWHHWGFWFQLACFESYMWK